MARQTSIANTIAIAKADAAVDSLDVGVGTARLEIRSGTKPANPDVAPPDGAVLATINLPNPAFGGAVDGAPGGVATANGVPLEDTAADATGEASWARAYDRDGTAKIDMTAGVVADDPDLVLNNKDIQLNAAVSVSSWTYTQPESQ